MRFIIYNLFRFFVKTFISMANQLLCRGLQHERIITISSHSHHCCSMYNTMNNLSAHPSYSHYYLLSPSTLFFVFFFCTSYCFFAHLVVFFAHLIVFCTSHCLLHILLFFAHLIVLHFFISLHILFLFLLFLPYVCPCYVTYIICILIVLHCH